MVPLHCPVPERPEEGDYVLAVRVQVLLQRFGLAQWTLGGIIAQNAIFSVYLQFQHAREAVEGKIPICRLRPSRQIAVASRQGEIHNAPVVEIAAWTARDEGKFGPRTVPPPLPLLAAEAAAPALPEPAADAAEFDLLPANDNGESERHESAPPAPLPALSNRTEKALAAIAKDSRKRWTAQLIYSSFRVYAKELNELVEAGRLIKAADGSYAAPAAAAPAANDDDPFTGMISAGGDHPRF
jgi:hypothetical protein